MPATRVQSRWNAGNLEFLDMAGNVICTYNGTARRMDFPATGLLSIGGTVVVATADDLNAWDTSSQVFFGNGADGDHTTVGAETLTSDMCYENLTVAAGHAFTTNGFIVRVQDTLTIAATGSIQVSTPVVGADGVGRDTGGAGGGATTTNTVPSQHVGVEGGDGGAAAGAGTAGTAGTALYTLVGGATGVAGGAGGAATSGGSGAGGAGGANSGSLAAGNVGLQFPSLAIQGTDIRLLYRAGGNGAGGGGGGGDNDGGTGGVGGKGGGSGSNAGAVVVFARNLAGAGVVEAIGGAGGAGAAGADGVGGDANGGGGGGGGAGGNGGLIYLVYHDDNSTITTVVTGGAVGTGGAGGALAGTGADGAAGADGTVGQAGVVLRFRV